MWYLIMRQILEFVTPKGKASVSDFISKLDFKVQRKISTNLINLKNSEYPMQPPLVKTFKLDKYKGLYELRVRIKQSVRIIFCLDKSGNIILLHGFIKKEERATRKALETARARQLALAAKEANITLKL